MFDFLKKPDMENAVEEASKNKNVHLFDARSREEYASGHIPGSSLFKPEKIGSSVPNKDDRIYVYCLSGGRSSQAKGYLEQNGYTDVVNLGGISRWHHDLETGGGR
ncbi:MAG: rhodanese-like domain-containing protein [Actinobacteria bacterium]|nr:rhodanese-like domain-containing protein [Actinomycetota bacterium]